MDAHRGTSRLLDLLELFANASPPSLTLSEMTARLRIPKSSLLLLLRTLESRGYLERRQRGGYRFTPRASQVFRDLWSGSMAEDNLRAASRPILESLAERAKETVCLALPAENGVEVVYVDCVEPAEVIRYRPNVGDHHPFYCTAEGRVCLAFLPEARRESYLRSATFHAVTPRTMIDADRLRGDALEVQKAGFAISVDERALGVSAIAAPLFDRAGVAIGACTVVGPTDRIVASRDRIATEVLVAAARISAGLGFAGEPAAGS